MRRVTQHELGFYDGLADRINRSLGHPACVMTQSSLAGRIGWNRASLCNFLNRIDKTIAAHFIPQIAQAFRLSVEELMLGGAPAAAAAATERTSWDPRTDDPEILIDKLHQWRQRNLPSIRLHGHLPPVVLPRHGMIASYVHSVFDGGCPQAAERWHEVIEAHKDMIADEGEGDTVNLIAYGDLLRLLNQEYPFERFSKDEIIFVLESMKKEWVRDRGLIFIVVDDDALTPEVKLELASSTCIGVVGRETRFEYGNDFRVRWSETNFEAARVTHERLVRLKKAAGFGARERPSARQVERLIDRLLCRLDVAARPDVRFQPMSSHRKQRLAPTLEAA
jgi:hypothetical protein